VPGITDLLLYGGIALIVIGVVVGVVVLIVALVRRAAARREESADSTAWPQLAPTSPFAAYTPPLTDPSESGSLSAAFVAGPPQPLPEPPGVSTGSAPEPSARLETPADPPALAAPPGSPVPPVPPASPGTPTPAESVSADPSWLEFVGRPDDAEPFQYTTGSFAIPAPLANPWVQPAAPAPAATPSSPAPPSTQAPAATPPTPAPPVTPAPSTPTPPAPEDDDDRTVIVPGRSTEPPAPWLLILDSGDRVEIRGDSVVVGRKPASIEQGVPGIQLPDPSRTLSKVHARLDRVGEYWTVTDLGSTNGVSVIESGRERLLPSGGSEPVRGRFLLGEVGLVLIRNPEAMR